MKVLATGNAGYIAGSGDDHPNGVGMAWKAPGWVWRGIKGLEG